MATIVGTIVGAYFGGPWGAQIGGTIGALIDQQIFAPKGKSQKGPRLDDVPISSAAEGAPVQTALGRAWRVGGMLLAAGELIEVVNEEKSGGGGKGGGGGSSVSTYTYFRHCAYALGEGPGAVKRLWFDNRVVYDGRIGAVTGDLFTSILRGPSGVPGLGGNIWGAVLPIGTAAALAGGAQDDLVGLTVNVLGKATFEVAAVGPKTAEFTGGASAFREVWRAVGADADDSGSTEPTVIDDGITSIVALPDLWDHVAFYDGGDDQPVDSLLEQISPIGESPAYRGTIYVVFERLALGKWGNRLPSLTAEVTGRAGTETVAGALSWLLDRAGIPADRREIDGFAGRQLAGMLINPGDTAEPVRQLLTMADGVVRQRNGVIQLIPRTMAQPVAIDPAHLGARGPAGGDARRMMLSRQVDATDIPRRVTTHYADAQAEYERATQSVAREAALVPSRSESVMNLDTVVMTADEAREIANRLLWRAWIERESGPLSLPPAYLRIEGGDWVTVPWQGQILTLRVTRRERRPDFTVQLDCIVVGAVPDPLAGAPGYNDPAPPYLPPVISLLVLQVPPLVSGQVTGPGYIIALRPLASADFWAGATLLQAADSAGPYEATAAVTVEASIGVTVTAMGLGPAHIWDHGNTVDVLFDRGEGPASIPEAGVLAGGNAVLLDEEIVQFRDAALVAPQTWRLATLLRGRRGTKIATHAGGTQAVMLDSAGLTWRGIEPAAIGRTTYLRALPRDGALAQTGIVPLAPSARNLKPFSPCHFAVSGTAAGDLILRWDRRDRAPWRLLTGDTPMSEAVERYKVRVIDGSDVKRAIVVTAPTAIYTAAMQAADFGGPAGVVTFKVSQYSSVVGWGAETVLEMS